MPRFGIQHGQQGTTMWLETQHRLVDRQAAMAVSVVGRDIVEFGRQASTAESALAPACNGSRNVTRYFLHLRDGTDVALDQEGREFIDEASLVAAMLSNARDIMSG